MNSLLLKYCGGIFIFYYEKKKQFMSNYYVIIMLIFNFSFISYVHIYISKTKTSKYFHHTEGNFCSSSD